MLKCQVLKNQTPHNPSKDRIKQGYTFQDTITPQLIEDQLVIDFSRFLFVVRNDTSYEVGFGAVQSVHQTGQLFLK